MPAASCNKLRYLTMDNLGYEPLEYGKIAY